MEATSNYFLVILNHRNKTILLKIVLYKSIVFLKVNKLHIQLHFRLIFQFASKTKRKFKKIMFRKYNYHLSKLFFQILYLTAILFKKLFLNLVQVYLFINEINKFQINLDSMFNIYWIGMDKIVKIQKCLHKDNHHKNLFNRSFLTASRVEFKIKKL